MPAQLVAELQRPFEIDRGALMPVADRRACQGFVRGLDREPAGLDRDDGQARSRTGDRGADRDRGGVPGGGDREVENGAAPQPPDTAEIGDDAGEHRAKLGALCRFG